MRNTRDSSNTRSMDWLIARAESSEWPSGFSSTMRACGPARPAMDRFCAIGANRLGEVAR